MSILLVKADITELHADAIVNAANNSLLGGGGVDGAIHKAAGPQLLNACKKLNGCETGEAKITKAYNLNAKYIIHTVGPIWQDGNHDEEKLLENAYLNSLKTAAKYKCTSVIFPNISTGVYNFPKQKAAQIAIETCRNFWEKNKELEIVFCCYDNENFNIYSHLLVD